MGVLDGKVAVITGSASGIGRASAGKFSAEGAAVVIADLNEQGGATVAEECRAAGGRAVFARTDVSVEADVQAVVARAVGEFGRLDIMFNNAGVGGALGRIEGTAVEDWDRTLAVLLRSVFLGMKHAVPELRKAGGGSIISTASIAGLGGGAAPHAYSAAKAAIINLTRSVALEVGADRIRVNCICPGGIVTPLIVKRTPGGEALVRRFLDQAQPIPRAGRPEDIAEMALFLASDAAQWITGTAMVVDGGLSAGVSLFAQALAASGVRAKKGFIGPSFEE